MCKIVRPVIFNITLYLYSFHFVQSRNKENNHNVLYGRVGVYIRGWGKAKIYRGEDILVAEFQYSQIKFFVAQELLELRDEKRDLWSIQFDFVEDRNEFLIECRSVQLEIVREAVVVIVLDDKDKEIAALKRKIAKFDEKKAIAALKRKIAELEDTLEETLTNFRQGTSKLEKLVDDRRHKKSKKGN